MSAHRFMERNFINAFFSLIFSNTFKFPLVRFKNNANFHFVMPPIYMWIISHLFVYLIFEVIFNTSSNDGVKKEKKCFAIQLHSSTISFTICIQWMNAYVKCLYRQIFIQQLLLKVSISSDVEKDTNKIRERVWIAIKMRWQMCQR